MRDVIRHRGGVVPLIVASMVFALWNTAYKYAVSGLPVTTVLSVMLLIGVGLRHVEATVSSMLDGTEACFVVAFGAIIARRGGLRGTLQRAHRPRAR